MCRAVRWVRRWFLTLVVWRLWRTTVGMIDPGKTSWTSTIPNETVQRVITYGTWRVIFFCWTGCRYVYRSDGGCGVVREGGSLFRWVWRKFLSAPSRELEKTAKIDKQIWMARQLKAFSQNPTGGTDGPRGQDRGRRLKR